MTTERPAFEISVNHFASVSLFMGYDVTKKNTFAKKVHEVCIWVSGERIPLTPNVGEVCGVYTQKMWVRGKVKNRFNTEDGNITYKMFLIDTGGYVDVPQLYLVPLNESMKKYPPQFLKFGIYGVVPDVTLCLKPRLYLSNFFKRGTPYFEEKVKIKNIAFGNIFIKDVTKSEVRSLTDMLLEKQLVKKSDNFEEDIIQFCSVFEDDDEEHNEPVNTPEQQLDNAGSVSFIQTKRDKDTVERTYQQENLRNVLPSKSTPDTGRPAERSEDYRH